MSPSYLINTDFSILGLSDFINDRPRNVFHERLGNYVITKTKKLVWLLLVYNFELKKQMVRFYFRNKRLKKDI